MIKEISPQELEIKVRSGGNFMLLDVRQPWEFNMCHLVGSINIPLGELDQTLTQVPDDKEIITICHHGLRSKQAAILLNQCGYVKVFSLQGGIDAWAQDIDPTMERY